MKLLLFEWLTGGGCWFDNTLPDPECPLQIQGAQMAQDLGHDLLKAGVRPVRFRDSRLLGGGDLDATLAIESAESLRRHLVEQAERCDAILLIAPECEGRLLMCFEWLEAYSSKFLSPNGEFIRLTSDKHQASQWLGERGVSVPPGARLEDCVLGLPTELSLPVVLKPIDGAGSEQIIVVDDWAGFLFPEDRSGVRVESFVPGTAVSVSVLCGVQGVEILPATGQIFDADPIGHYIGAVYPLSEALTNRAVRLAKKTVNALPPTRGYFGIDMILGPEGESSDCVVDVNPRLTASYSKLREICGFNIAERMLRGFGNF